MNTPENYHYQDQPGATPLTPEVVDVYAAPVPATTTPADWYPDPYHLAALRYWDGNAWTAHVSGAPAAQPQVGTVAGAYAGPGGHATTVVVQNGATNQKSAGLAFVLTFFFGPLGMLYSTVAGAITMFFVNVVMFALVVITFGLGIVLWPVVYVVQLVWAVTAVSKHNQAQGSTVAVATAG